MTTTQRKLFNRFDQYEIASIFTETAEQALPKKWKINRKTFYIKCILGTLLFLNGYLSHWGPWPWPSNYYFLIFSVIFYHTATYFYSAQSPVNNAEGNTVGEFNVKGKTVSVVLRIGQSKQIYTLEALQRGASVAKKDMPYYQYFTQSGVFLSYKFKRDIDELIKSVEQKVGQ